MIPADALQHATDIAGLASAQPGGRPPSSLALRPGLWQAKRFAVQSVLGGVGKVRCAGQQVGL